MPKSIALAIGSALTLMPPTGQEATGVGREALILCAGEHGFVGGFNERLLDAVCSTLESSALLFVMGARGAALAAERGRAIAWSGAMATRPAAAPISVGALTAELYSLIAYGEVSRVDIIFSRYTQGDRAAIERIRLLPLDLDLLARKKPRQAPLHNLKSETLFEKLAAEYVFALLTEAAVEFIASENAARFAAMDSANRNISRKQDLLRQLAREARQTETTAELLELITGAEALEEGGFRPFARAGASATE